MNTDHQLMVQVRDGRIAQLGELFERHHVRLFNFFLRLTGRRPVAEDLVQEVFVRILKYRRTYRSDGDFLTWVYRLSRNVAADHFRKHGQTLLSPEEVAEPESPEPLPLQDLEAAESRTLLRTALGRLPVDKRELLILSRYQGLKYEQIGELLGCKVGAVKVRVHRAVKQLRDIYFTLANEVPT